MTNDDILWRLYSDRPQHSIAKMSVRIEDVAEAGGISLDYLDRQMSDQHVLLFSKYCDPWELIGPHLGHSPSAITAIDRDYRTTELKRRAMIQKWKEKNIRATYLSFLKVLIDCEKVQSACAICSILGEEG